MKNIIYSLFILIIIIPFSSEGQSITPNPGKVWGGQEVTYTRSDFDLCRIGWEVFSGVFPDHQNSRSIAKSFENKTVKVKWNNISTTSGRIDFTRADCYHESNNLKIQSHTGYVILSLINQNIGNITGPSVPNCSNSPIIFSIPRTVIPHSYENQVFKYASGYEWTIPSGWTGPNGEPGPILINNSNAFSISLIPKPCASGQEIIRVRAFTDTEGKGDPHYSNYSAVFNVSRSPVTLSTPTEAKCSVPFTASIPALACASSYTWNVPPGWQIQGSGPSVTLIPSKDSGNISVAANFSDGSCDPLIISKPIQVTSDIEQISGLDNGACGSSFSVPSLPTGSTVSWTFSSNLQRVSPPNFPSLTVVPTNPSSYAPGWVKATVTNPNGCNFEKTRDIWVGIPGLPSISYQSFNVYGGGSFTAPSFEGASTDYLWTTSSSLTVISGGGTKDKTITVSINPNHSFGDIFVTARNSCGNSQQPSQIRVNRIQSFNYTVYPNPVVTEDFTVEAVKIDTASRELMPFEVKLYDEAGNELLTKKLNKEKSNISVSKFKKGFYYIHIITEEGIIRKKIRIEK